tara:strand:- start:299 stop:874 length:576 start_codon:yes stop_codon:yes gene_type:complete
MANRYTFPTTLNGFVNVFEDSGKYNLRSFAYTVPKATLQKMESDREELLQWARSKSSGRVQEAMTPWDEAGLVKYSYGAGDGSRKPKPEPVFVDTDGAPLSPEILRDVRAGTKANLIVQQKPYSMGPNIGTSLRVVGVQVVELVTNNGAVDSGTLSVDEIAGMFGKVDGFKASDPAVRQVESAGKGDDYDF